VADDDPIIANEHVLDHQTDDALPLDDVKRVGGFTQSREKGRQRFRETQVRRSFSSLFGDRLQLRPQGTLALTQGRHPLAQLLQRQQLLLIGGQHTLDAFSDPDEIPLQRLLALPGRVSGASDGEAAIELLLNQCGIFE
jgi:hypothetical protein